LLATSPAGEPAGFVTVGGDWIVQAGLVPGWRRRGVGTLLVRAAMAGLAAEGAVSCWLTVATNNPGAISLTGVLASPKLAAGLGTRTEFARAVGRRSGRPWMRRQGPSIGCYLAISAPGLTMAPVVASTTWTAGAK
jgi:GNAT superfamily N-acetyltransferase